MEAAAYAAAPFSASIVEKAAEDSQTCVHPLTGVQMSFSFLGRRNCGLNTEVSEQKPLKV